MPELPEVEITRRGLAREIEGRRLVHVQAHRPDLRFPFPPDFARRLEGRHVERLDRRAKYILVRLEAGLTWLIHLGMSGRMIVGPGAMPDLGKHDHVSAGTDAGGHMIYQDARRFGF
ncbi:MAG: DNA-formamidopyrimidine glycosylase family protein, partial [Alphaproteobacteria bacterium]